MTTPDVPFGLGPRKHFLINLGTQTQVEVLCGAKPSTAIMTPPESRPHCPSATVPLSLLSNTPTGKYTMVLDSDAWHFGGQGRVPWGGEHFTTPATEEEGGKLNDRDQYFQVSLSLGVESSP